VGDRHFLLRHASQGATPDSWRGGIARRGLAHRRPAITRTHPDLWNAPCGPEDASRAWAGRRVSAAWL